MGFMAATIELLGPDARILEADRFLNAELQGRPQTLEISAKAVHHSILLIVGDCNDDAVGIDRTIAWLVERESKLWSLDSAITIEIECVLLPVDASRFLTISAENLTVLADLGCGLRIQYMKSTG